MKNLTPKIKVVLATRHFLCRLGLKSALGLAGVDMEIIEEHSPDHVLNELNTKSDIHFFVLHQDTYSENKTAFINTIKNNPHDKQIMLVGDHLFSENTPVINIPLTASKEEVSEGLNKLFANHKENEKEEENALTERETQVLRHVALGLANKEIADRLFISINTVITHRKNITEKLEIKTIAGLTVYAIMNKIIAPDEVTF